MKRRTDAFVCGGLGDADHREQLHRLQEQLAASGRAPDEHRMHAATMLAQDFAALCDRARPEKRKQMIAATFEAVRIRDGRTVAVLPKSELAPVFAARLQTGGPDRGLTRGCAVFAGVLIEGLEDLATIADGVA